jgi:hypothetical protein
MNEIFYSIELFFIKDRLMKPLAGYIGYNSEWRELAQVISRVSFKRQIKIIIKID